VEEDGEMLDHIVKGTLRVYFGIFYRVKIKGMENVPKEGGLILCANHIGQLDMFFIAYRIKRLVHYMAKAELFKNPIVKWFLTNVGAFPVKRGTGDIGAAKTVYKMLKSGKIVGIMPEGTRTKGKEHVKAKSGAAMFALGADVPILPVGISGSYKLFTKVYVNIGKPFKLEHEGKATQEELAAKSEEIMKKIYALVEERN
jgi:1-acyl-sn-glycerol-3-phosphate acyltransferase